MINPELPIPNPLGLSAFIGCNLFFLIDGEKPRIIPAYPWSSYTDNAALANGCYH
jgi:hypothetical protein